MTERATLSELKKLDPEALVALIVAQQEQFTAPKSTSTVTALIKCRAGLLRLLPRTRFRDNFRVADQPPGISVSLQVENKYFIGNGHLIGSSLR